MWVKIELHTDDEIFNDVISKGLTKDTITAKMRRNGGERPFGYFSDLLLDNYDVTLAQNDRIARRLVKHFGFEE